MSDEIPMVWEYEDGDPAKPVHRPMTADEIAERTANGEADAAAVVLPQTLEEKLIGALEALPPDRVVSASELLAILRPKENPDA